MALNRKWRAGLIGGAVIWFMAHLLFMASPWGGIYWSDGKGKLWGVDGGSWVETTLFAGTPAPVRGVRIGNPQSALGKLAGGGPFMVQMTSITSISPLVLAPLGLLGGWLVARRIKPFAAWQCQKCGYDRRGLIENAACPECGTGARVESIAAVQS